jgi:hypothetical protein
MSSPIVPIHTKLAQFNLDHFRVVCGIMVIARCAFDVCTFRSGVEGTDSESLSVECATY